MAKMYLQVDNSGRCLLITDELGNWYHIEPNSNGMIGGADIYPEADTEDKELFYALWNIRHAIKKGDLYNADEFIEEYGITDDCGNSGENNRFLALKYAGYAFEDIDRVCNYNKDGTPKSCHTVSWEEIRL